MELSNWTIKTDGKLYKDETLTIYGFELEILAIAEEDCICYHCKNLITKSNHLAINEGRCFCLECIGRDM